MNEHENSQDHNRFLEAADAVLDAIVELAKAHGGVCPYPSSVMGTDEQPACLARFTPDEIDEATAFLMRAGYLETDALAD
ncbi:MAG: hypothetical protein H6811_02080 [Phycisphaeraceae bacterium]|nr:hypothetical protein [Phycisphaeraceae bacterium]